MRRVFNLGIGVIAIVDRNAAERISEHLRSFGTEVWAIGQVTK